MREIDATGHNHEPVDTSEAVVDGSDSVAVRMLPEQNGKRTSEALLGHGAGGYAQVPAGPPWKLRCQDFVPMSASAAAGREQFQWVQPHT